MNLTKFQNTQWNSGVQIGKPKQGGVMEFWFPTDPNSVNDVQAQLNGPLNTNQVIAISYQLVNPDPKEKVLWSELGRQHMPGGLKPNFRPMLQQKDDNWIDPNGRWYPTGVMCGFLTFVGVQSFHVPLHPDYWQNVDGKVDPHGFKDFLPRAANLSLVFGAETDFAHGIALKQGKAQFKLVSCTIA